MDVTNYLMETESKHYTIFNFYCIINDYTIRKVKLTNQLLQWLMCAIEGYNTFMYVTAVAGAPELFNNNHEKKFIAIIICNMIMWSFWSVLFRFAIRLPMESHSLISYHSMWYETVGLWTSRQPPIGILSTKT